MANANEGPQQGTATDKPVLVRLGEIVAAVREIVIAILLAIIIMNQLGAKKIGACRANLELAGLVKTLSVGGRFESTGMLGELLGSCETTVASPDGLKVVAEGPPTHALAALPIPGETMPSKAPPSPVEPTSETIVPVAPTQTPPAVPSLTTPQSQPTSVEAFQGWVALGFLPEPPATADDTVFILPKGKTLATIAKGDEVTTLTSVNLRKGAADWTSPRTVVGRGRTGTVSGQPEILKAGKLRQVWAPVVFR